jgi:hypothetical protein
LVSAARQQQREEEIARMSNTIFERTVASEAWQQWADEIESDFDGDISAGPDVRDVTSYLRSFAITPPPQVREALSLAVELLLKEMAPDRVWPESVKEGLAGEIFGLAQVAAWARLREAEVG